MLPKSIFEIAAKDKKDIIIKRLSRKENGIKVTLFKTEKLKSVINAFHEKKTFPA